MEQELAKISKVEVRRAMKRIKSGKAVGPDIPVEVQKCLKEVEVQVLTRSFKRC